MNIGPLEDRVEIRELIESFAAAAMRIDSSKWAENWIEEGVWKLASFPEPVHGKDNFVAAFEKAMAYVDTLSMICFPADMVIDGDTAHGNAYCREQIFTTSGGEIIVIGCYKDEYVKRDGRWLFKSRFYEILRKEIRP